MERGLAGSRERAQALILAGQVVVGDRRVDKPGTAVPSDAPIRLKGADLPWVSRGGAKLAGALDDLGLDPGGWTCLDVGASTGGFTDCLLQRGAARVYAVDVGTGQLAFRLTRDPRVVSLERTDIRALPEGTVPAPVDLATIDTSFISLRLVLPATLPWVRPGGWVLALVKPQFEVGRARVAKGGVVRDETDRQEALESARALAGRLGLVVQGETESRLPGARSGNREHFMAFRVPTPVGLPPTPLRDGGNDA